MYEKALPSFEGSGCSLLAGEVHEESVTESDGHIVQGEVSRLLEIDNIAVHECDYVVPNDLPDAFREIIRGLLQEHHSAIRDHFSCVFLS